jgi:hypothetical protein
LVIASPALSLEPEISPLGQGRYLATIQAATGFSGTKHLRAKALRSAASFCEGKGMDFETLTATGNEAPFVLGKYPRGSVREFQTTNERPPKRGHG